MAYCSLLRTLSALLLIAAAASTNNGEEARWLVQSSKWATLSWLEGEALKSLIVSIAESNGRIFFYLTEDITFKASITLSEAQVNPEHFFGAKCGPDGDLDPEDPRCAKLTISGVVAPCAAEDDSKQLALDTLFVTHPQMKDWPEDHGFVACEMKIDDDDGLWMIANYGGGGYMDAADYHDADPKQHAAKGFGGDRALAGSGACYDPNSHACECLAEKCGLELCSNSGGMWTTECATDCECEPSASVNVGGNAGHEGHGGHGEHGDHAGHGEHGDWHGEQGDHAGHGEHGDWHAEQGDHGGHGEHGGHESKKDPADDVAELPLLPRPDFQGDAAGHARWMVAKSLWTTISTVSSTKEGEPFGNIRSIVDGNCFMGSSGLPYFYLPAPDPTTMDIKANTRIALSFTEAALAEKGLNQSSDPCGGKDAEDPTCGKLTLMGHAKVIEDKDQIKLAMKAFKVQHPRASWLSSGGAHTGGNYYTLDLTEIMFLQSYGGFTSLSAEKYLDWKPDPSKFAGEPQCHIDESRYIDDARQSTSAPASSVSMGFIVVVILSSFFGSLLGGLLNDKVKSIFYAKRQSGYSKARSVDNDTLEVEATTKEWA